MNWPQRNETREAAFYGMVTTISAGASMYFELHALAALSVIGSIVVWWICLFGDWCGERNAEMRSAYTYHKPVSTDGDV